MLLYYKLYKAKKKVDSTTEEICKILGLFNSSELISLELNQNHILKIRNYVLGHYINTTILFSRLYSNNKILNGITNIFTPLGQNISKTIFKNELLLLKKEFQEYEKVKEKEGESCYAGSELLLIYLDNLAHKLLQLVLDERLAHYLKF